MCRPRPWSLGFTPHSLGAGQGGEGLDQRTTWFSSLFIKTWLKIATQYKKTTWIVKGAKDSNRQFNRGVRTSNKHMGEKMLNTVTSRNAN